MGEPGVRCCYLSCLAVEGIVDFACIMINTVVARMDWGPKRPEISQGSSVACRTVTLLTGNMAELCN
jgi:hypothetical protein